MAKRSLGFDVALGAVCGLGATWLMTQVGKGLKQVGTKPTLDAEKQAGEEAGAPATVNVAKAVARPFGFRIEGREDAAGNIVHYGYGATWGAAYALLAHTRPWRWWSAGITLGSLLWLVGDEVLVPLLGFARGPDAYPATVHAKALASHLAYGVGLVGAREAVRAFV